MITAVVIGASAGGIDALITLLKNLPRSFSLPIMVAQHIAPTSEVDPDTIFGSYFGGRVSEAHDKTNIEKSNVYFAPADYHLLIEKDLSLALSQDEPVKFSRPSIDVLFESAANAFGDSVCGVLLTGANDDGAQGLKAIHDVGGYTIVQNLEEATCDSMPRSALQLFQPHEILTLSEIAKKLSYFSEKGSP